MNILLLSRYGHLGASSRVRSFQYLPYLDKNGLNVDVEPLFSDEYLAALYSGNSRWKMIVRGYLHRLRILVSIQKYDLIWLEKEIFPFFPAVFERFFNLLGVPYVVDYDDAIFHRYDQHHSWLIRVLLGRKIDAVMRHASLVITGNAYLAERARSAGARRVEIVPTVVDLDRYSHLHDHQNHTLVVGWIGTPSTSFYLLALKPVFESLKDKFDVRFVAVGALEKDLSGVPVEAWSWSEETEVQSIQMFDIGIMPLMDTPWERGKCGYKLIQYMACGLPVVASLVGVNGEIIKHGDNGFLAHDLHEWEQALCHLLSDQGLRRRMGSKGRERVKSWYSLQMQAPRLKKMMCGIVE